MRRLGTSLVLAGLDSGLDECWGGEVLTAAEGFAKDLTLRDDSFALEGLFAGVGEGLSGGLLGVLQGHGEGGAELGVARFGNDGLVLSAVGTSKGLLLRACLFCGEVAFGFAGGVGGALAGLGFIEALFF